jgi:hypothetical protein
MSKDPAILFYTSDFLTGTMTMTHEQAGKYIRLLCMQHQKGILSEKDMIFICGSYDEDIFSKFVKTDQGYYNERMRFEAEKRANYSLSRSSNRSNLNKKQTKKHMKKICKSYDEHMENENTNENEDIIKNKKVKYIDSVLLTESEYKKLQEVLGQKSLDEAIEKLDYSITVKGGKYKDHYKTILNWNKRGFLNNSAEGEGSIAAWYKKKKAEEEQNETGRI